MDSNVYTILLCGVGGQGTITAADLLARVATAAGLDCKVSEIHGMAQRLLLAVALPDCAG